MAQRIYEGIDNVARNTIRAYGGIDNKARTLVRGYLGDAEGVARQFWGALGYVIFDNGEWHYVPQGFDLVQNYAETNGKVSDLTTDYLSDKLLWVHDADINRQWVVNNDDLLDSQMNDYENQICKNEIYIPIERIEQASKLRIIAKGNLTFNAMMVGNNRVMGSLVKDKAICGSDLTVKELDISLNSWIDYIKISAPDEYEATNEDVTNPYVYQPIPFKIQNYLYTNEKGNTGIPGYEVVQLTGGDLYCFLKYREPDGSNQCVYIMSKEPFTIDWVNNALSSPIHTTIASTQIQADPPVHALIQEGAYWGYKFQDMAVWHTNYYGGWNTYWDIDVGNIVLYGHLNILPTPTGVQKSLQLIKRIEVIGGEIPNNNE